jgi:ribosomal protein S18 acetylase RimI-like enzyme
LALPRDVAAVAALQAHIWQRSYESLVPAEALAEVESVALDQWTLAVHAAPTDAHHLLVAIEFDNASEQVVGFAAVAPSDDPDADPRTVGQLVTLLVDPTHQRQGHGTRLLSAAVDTMRANLFHTATTWQRENDDAMLALLARTGWEPDGARRNIDTGVATLTEVRLHTAVIS